MTAVSRTAPDRTAARPHDDLGATEVAQPAGARRFRRLVALGWSAMESGARQFIGLALSFAVLALITPRDLGIFTLAYAINQIPSILIDEPIIEALIQRETVRERDWNTGFTVNLAVSALSAAVSLTMGGTLARWIGEPALTWAVPVVSLCTLLASFGFVQKGYLARELEFRVVAKTMLLSQVVAGLGALAMALFGLGYWSLIGNLAIFSVMSSILWWRFCPWRPRFALDWATVRWIGKYAGGSVALRFVLLCRDNAPAIVIASAFGTVVNGYFSLAFRIARTLGLFFEDLTRMPVMAVLSREQADDRVASTLLVDICTVVGAVGIPAFLGLILVGGPLPSAVFGENWQPSGPMLPWLAIVVGGWLMLHLPSIALRATGRIRLSFLLTAPPILLDLALLVTLAPLGLHRVLIAMAARAALAVPLVALALNRWLRIPVLAWLVHLRLPLAGAAVMTVVVLAVERRLGGDLRGLIAAGVAGTAAYAAVVGLFSLTMDRSVVRAARRIG